MSLTTQQIEARKHGIGASEAAAALGLSKFDGPLGVYNTKVNGKKWEGNDLTEWGDAQEPALLAWYGRKRNVSVIRPTDTFKHPKFPFILATLDGYVPNGSANSIELPIEAKTANVHVAKQWGDPGTDQIPIEYKIQAQQQMIVTGRPLVHVIATIGGMPPEIYVCENDPEFAELIIDGLNDFWHQHVLAKVPPEPRTVEEVNATYRRSITRALKASDDVIVAHRDLTAVKAELKSIEGRKEELELVIKGFLKEADCVVDPATGEILCTWKTAKDSEKFDAEAFRAASEQNDFLYRMYLKSVPGSRRFLVK